MLHNSLPITGPVFVTVKVIVTLLPALTFDGEMLSAAYSNVV